MVERENAQGMLERVNLFAANLAKWDKRIVEVVGVGSITGDDLASDHQIELVCVFDPEPMDETQGFFSIANLMVRNEIKKTSELLGITNSIDLGFTMNGKYFLPDGRISEKPEEQITFWQQSDELNTHE